MWILHHVRYDASRMLRTRDRNVLITVRARLVPPLYDGCDTQSDGRDAKPFGLAPERCTGLPRERLTLSVRQFRDALEGDRIPSDQRRPNEQVSEVAFRKMTTSEFSCGCANLIWQQVGKGVVDFLAGVVV
jgi:hypothetical protein